MGDAPAAPGAAASDYEPGSIRRIRLVNFMIHSEVNFCPGPRLNLVLGANGTGKSAVACAIGLGLGGTTKIVSRSTDLKGYIKNDQQSALIEIELQGKDGGKNPIVKRRLQREGVKDQWYLNDVPRKKEDMDKFFEVMNIQVNNLCQYLPQDQVGNFSKFDDKELLRETVRAVKGEKHAKLQDDLVSLQKRLKDDRKSFASKEEEHKAKAESYASMEREVLRQESRQKLLDEIQLCKIKAAWLRFEDARTKFKAAKENVEKVQREVSECKSERLPQLKAREDQLKKETAALANEVSVLETAYKDASKHLKRSIEDIDNDTTDLKELQERISNMQQRQDQARKKVADQRKKIAELERKIAALPSDEELARQHEEARAEYKAATDFLDEIQIKVTEAASEVTRARNALQQAEKFSAPKAAAASLSSSDAISRLNENPERIAALREACNSIKHSKRIIYGPIVNCISVKDSVAARALEVHTRKPYWCFFITTNESDRDFVMSLPKAPGGVMNIAANSTAASNDKPRPRIGEELMHQLGLRGFLDEMVSGDAIVIEALRRTHKIHHILIGSAKTDEAFASKGDAILKSLVDEVARNGFVDKLIIFSPKFRREVATSRYDRQVTTNMRELEDNPSMGAGKNFCRIVRPLETPAVPLPQATAAPAVNIPQLKAKVEECEIRQSAVKEEHKMANLAREKAKAKTNVVLDARTNRRKDIARLDTLQRELGKLEEDANKDWVAALAKENAKLTEASSVLVSRTMKAVAVNAAKVVEADVALSTLAAHHEAKVVELEVYHLAVKDAEIEENSGAQRIQKAKEEEDKWREEAKKLKAAAEKIHPLTEEIKEKWNLAQIGDVLEELEVQIKELQLRADAIHVDPTVVANYQLCKSQLQMLEAQLATLQEEIEKKTSLLQEQFQEWRNPVDAMVKEIDKSMRDFFDKIAQDGYRCASEVELQGNEEDYSSFGIVISVKFREEQKMQRLSATVHSGGERSLTTFLYMLSLQTLSKAPFRLVDEINQGMDADKERLAFYRLQAVATGRKTPQYFVITPKLLPGLRYTKDTTVLFVFNGFFNIDQKDWNVEKFLAARRKRARSIADRETDQGSEEVA